ncbi:MAG: YihA family ribosome biogenesis GTP-binding protein [Verrucomicrobiaceae bacterium]|nr:MAG: YihA family ribosome biogenesis GTP-binding protein [Verrucomicrobiaceae bacterium]
MKFKSVRFALSAKNAAACPEWEMPEIALIGRSNVGKSTLINLLTSKEDLAKVSATPGKTQLLNFFVIDEQWALVDLPGYGFAKVAKSQKIDFNEAVGDYLSGRDNLMTVFVLIDSRLPPQRIDLDFLDWLCGCSVPFSLIFTKTDKQSVGKTKAAIETFLQATDAFMPDRPGVFTSSTKEREGRMEILRFIRAKVEA